MILVEDLVKVTKNHKMKRDKIFIERNYCVGSVYKSDSALDSDIPAYVD